jgi:hypothetical protein
MQALLGKVLEEKRKKLLLVREGPTAGRKEVLKSKGRRILGCYLNMRF